VNPGASLHQAVLADLGAQADGWAVLLAWLVVAAWVVREGPRAARLSPPDSLRAVLLTLGALLLRLAVPWGPLNFAEAQRVAPLFSPSFVPFPDFRSLQTLYALPMLVGLPGLAVYRALPPLLSSLGVGLTYAFARRAGARPLAAAVGAAMLLASPLHVRYSASAGLSTEASTLLLALLLAVASPSLHRRWRSPLVAALAVLCVFGRPELRLVPLMVAPLLFAPHWNNRDRVTAGALAALGVLPYVPHLSESHATDGRSPIAYILADHAHTLLTLGSVSPVAWLALGAAGLAAGRMERRARLSMLVSLAIFAVAYTVAGGEFNPLWGCWRYYVVPLPLLAVGVAALAERLAAAAPPRAATALLVALQLLAYGAVVQHRRLLWRRVDIQDQFHFLLETAPRMLAGRDLMILSNNPPDPARPFVDNIDDMQLFAVGLRRPGVPLLATTCDWGFDPRSGATRVLSAAAAGGCFAPERTVLFLGLFRPADRVAALRARFDLEPLLERTVNTSVLVPFQDTQCPAPMGHPVGMALGTCPVRLGWYRLRPRAAAP